MKRLLLGFAASQFVGAASAAALCATPQDMKALQAAALEQQLAAAAQSCHQGADFQHFVARYRTAMAQSDEALKIFFARHADGEGYQSYKSRLAMAAALRSQSDPHFCENAKAVFALALAHQDLSTAPSLIKTGYEVCRPDWALQLAKNAAPKPAIQTAPASTLALALVPVPSPRVAPQQRLAAMPRVAHSAPPREMVSHGWIPLDPPAQTAPEPRSDNVPNAYQPGSYWVLDKTPSSWTRQHDPALYQGADGRWYVSTTSRAQ